MTDKIIIEEKKRKIFPKLFKKYAELLFEAIKNNLSFDIIDIEYFDYNDYYTQFGMPLCENIRVGFKIKQNIDWLFVIQFELPDRIEDCEIECKVCAKTTDSMWNGFKTNECCFVEKTILKYNCNFETYDWDWQDLDNILNMIYYIVNERYVAYYVNRKYLQNYNKYIYINRFKAFVYYIKSKIKIKIRNKQQEKYENKSLYKIKKYVNNKYKDFKLNFICNNDDFEKYKIEIQIDKEIYDKYTEEEFKAIDKDIFNFICILNAKASKNNSIIPTIDSMIKYYVIDEKNENTGGD